MKRSSYNRCAHVPLMDPNRLRKKTANTPLSREGALDCRPIKNRDVLEESSTEGLTLLTYPVQPRAWVSALLKRFGKSSPNGLHRKLQLDDLGGEVWALMDGRLRVRDIIEKFAGAHGLSPQEAELPVTRFLRELGKRGLVAMMQAPETIPSGKYKGDGSKAEAGGG